MYSILLAITAAAIVVQMVKGVSRLLSLILLLAIGICLFIGYGGGGAFSAVAAVFSILTALIIMLFTFRLAFDAIRTSFASDARLISWSAIWDGILLFIVNVSSIVTLYEKITFLMFLWS